jgi:hypothetical protein
MQFRDLDYLGLCSDNDLGFLLPGAALMVRSGVFERAGHFPTDYGYGDFEDGELSYRIRALSDLEIVQVPFFHVQGHSFVDRHLIETFCRSRILDSFVNQKQLGSVLS